MWNFYFKVPHCQISPSIIPHIPCMNAKFKLLNFNLNSYLRVKTKLLETSQGLTHLIKKEITRSMNDPDWPWDWGDMAPGPPVAGCRPSHISSNRQRRHGCHGHSPTNKTIHQSTFSIQQSKYELIWTFFH